MTALLQEIVALLTGGITSIATGIGSGLQNLVSEMFLVTTGDTTTLSVFGGVICIFAGISLCIGLSRLIFEWLISFGK